jgi:hypothetical protein
MPGATTCRTGFWLPGSRAALPYNAWVRFRAFHRSLSLMAFVAMLLIVLAPLVSRWVAHGAEAGHSEAVHAIEHHPSGMQQHEGGEHHHHGTGDATEMTMSADHDHHAMVAHAEVRPLQDHAGKPRNDPHAGHDMGVDCDYCLIAARMVSLLVALLLALIGWRPPHFARAWTLSWGSSIAAGHLGARGPPLRA